MDNIIQDIITKSQELTKIWHSQREDIVKKAKTEAQVIICLSKQEKKSLDKQIIILKNKTIELSKTHQSQREDSFEKAKIEANSIIEKAKLEKESLEKQIITLKNEIIVLAGRKKSIEIEINKNVKGEIIKLNVGGKIFTTTTTTLQKSSTMLSVLVSGKYKTLRDENGNIFIDRNPKFFEHVLKYLRNGFRQEKPDMEYIDEFKYFGFDVEDWQNQKPFYSYKCDY